MAGYQPRPGGVRVVAALWSSARISFLDRVSWQAVGEDHEGGDLVGGEMLSAPGQKFLLLARLDPGRHSNEGCHHLRTAGVWDWCYACLGHRRVAKEEPV